MDKIITRNIGGKSVTLTLERIDPRTGLGLWYGDNGRHYSLINGHWTRMHLGL